MSRANHKPCERCPRPRIPGERFCEPCRVDVRREMFASGYLTPLPPAHNVTCTGCGGLIRAAFRNGIELLKCGRCGGTSAFDLDVSAEA
jgi:ribosomal protein S27AE